MSLTGRDPEVLNSFLEFFDEEYFVEASNFEQGEFELDLNRVMQFDEELVDGLVENPDIYIESITGALAEFCGYESTENIQIRFENLPERYYIPIRDLRAEHTNKLVGVTGIASQSTAVRPKLELAVFRCTVCGTEIHLEQTSEEIRKPSGCTSEDCNNTTKRNFQLLTHRSETEDFQKIQVQESPNETKGGESPQDINFTIRGEKTGIVLTGRKVEAIGILRAQVGSNNSSILRTHIEGNNIEVEDNENTTELTDADIEQIESWAEHQDILEQLAESVAPTIEGHMWPKKGIVLQLFSGIRKKLPEGSKIRGNIHVLLVGDPGTGKSQIIQYSSDLIPTNGVFTSGKGSSAAGLTAAVVSDKDFAGDDKYTLKAGALVLADNGMAAVDELDKMSDSDRSALHEALEQQQISVNKAGINATLKSRCSMLAAANPKYGRFEEFTESVIEQIELPPALMSRFDLIFVVRDELDEENDRQVARTILDNNQRGQRSTRKREKLKEEVDGPVPQEYEDEITDDNRDIFTKEEFRKYISYAQNIYPEITEKAKSYIEEEYITIRQSGVETDTYPITARKIEAMIRMTEAVARVKLEETATKEHAQIALDIIKESMKQTGMNDEGQFDADIVETGVSSSQRDRIQSVTDAVEMLIQEKKDQGKEDVSVTEEEIIEAVQDELNMSEDKITKTIKRLSEKGELYTPAGGGYLIVS